MILLSAKTSRYSAIYNRWRGNASKSRILCLILCILTLPLEAFAGGTGAGKGDNVVPVAGKYTSAVVPKYAYVGMAIGIQVMDGSRYTIDPDEEPVSGGIVEHKGIAETIKHFTYNYPNPMESSSGQSCYFLGVAGQCSSGNQYVYGPVGNINGDAYAEPITSVGYGTGSWDTYIHDGLFNSMIATEEMPQKVLTSDILDNYWMSMCGPLNSKAKNVVHYIWGSSDFTSAYYSSDATGKFKEYLRIGTDLGAADVDYKIRAISNYVATLLCVASQLPSDVQTKAYNAIKNFAISASTGKPFQPIVVTAEACARTQWRNEVNGSDHISVWM